jgi:hypothetical protein
VFWQSSQPVLDDTPSTYFVCLFNYVAACSDRNTHFLSQTEFLLRHTKFSFCTAAERFFIIYYIQGYPILCGW